MREEMQRFMHYVEKSRHEEAERDKQVEQLVNEEVEKQWQKKDTRKRMERDARKVLLHNVLQTREIQIQERGTGQSILCVSEQFVLSACLPTCCLPACCLPACCLPACPFCLTYIVNNDFQIIFFSAEIMRSEQEAALKERKELRDQMEEHRRLEKERINRIRHENRQYKNDLEQQINYQRNLKAKEIGEAKKELESLHVRFWFSRVI